MKVYIINPDNNELCTVEDWRGEKDRERAKFVVLELDNGERRMYYKNRLKAKDGSTDMSWSTALSMGDEFTVDGLDGWRIESRREALECAGDAWNIFPEAVELIGGDIIRDWFWTRDAFQSFSGYAWVFSGSSGSLTYGSRSNSCAARVFRAF